MIVDPPSRRPDGRNSIHTIERIRGRASFDQFKLVAHPVFTHRVGPCPLPEELTHRQPLAHLFG